jgi:hypothetical protein
MCDYDYQLEINFYILYHVYALCKKATSTKIENLNQESN